MKSRSYLLFVMVVASAFLMAGTVLAGMLPFAAGDVLLNKLVTAKTYYDASYQATNATDGTFLNYCSTGGSRQAQVGVGGFDDAIRTIRIWSDNDTTAPLTVSIRSSTKTNITSNLVSLVADDYEKTLCSNLTLNWETYYDTPSGDYFYCTLDVSAFAVNNTKSLYFDFQGDQGASFVRIDELQAYNTAIPEPSTILIFGTGLIGLFNPSWRKRK
ncbi:MAG: PEP-CTERM sorting domain-containing protein [Lentisphaeria bacterium]